MGLTSVPMRAESPDPEPGSERAHGVARRLDRGPDRRARGTSLARGEGEVDRSRGLHLDRRRRVGRGVERGAVPGSEHGRDGRRFPQRGAVAADAERQGTGRVRRVDLGGELSLGPAVELASEVEGHDVGERLQVTAYDALHAEVHRQGGERDQQDEDQPDEHRHGAALVSTRHQLTLALETKTSSEGRGTSTGSGVSGLLSYG